MRAACGDQGRTVGILEPQADATGARGGGGKSVGQDGVGRCKEVGGRVTFDYGEADICYCL